MRKTLSQEDDITILKEYSRQTPIFPSFRELAFIVGMIFLYYTGYARWFFWALGGLVLLILLIYIVNGIPGYTTLLNDELKRRGYSNKEYYKK